MRRSRRYDRTHRRKNLLYKKAAIIAGIILMAAVVFAGCRNEDKVDESAPYQGEMSLATSELENSGEAAGQESVEITLPLTTGDQSGETDGPQEPDVVADTSPLEGDITKDNGFTDTDEVVYVTQNLVNIRSDCTTDSRIVAQLNEGDSLKRTGYSEGWSRVLYQDQTCFVSSDFVTTEAPGGETAQDVRALSDAASAAAESENSAPVSNGRIIAIDAGHQAKGNSEKEPIGPGSSTMKAKVASGAEGVVTKLPEYKLTLSVSQKLKRILEERGYQVVMIRDSNDVNISNAERAEIANKSGAALFVRVHANSLDNGSVRGVLAMCQTEGNPYNGELHAQSYYLSRLITDGISAATGFKNRGVQETDTMSGINWCTIPVSIVEMGFMSNPEEDQLMAQDEYQEKIASGIAAGIDAYFGG